MNEKSKRLYNIDLLKVIAAIFVIVLHVQGTVKGTLDINSYSVPVKNLFYIIEAFCYPAIHLFVLSGAVFMYKKAPKLKNFLNIYISTLIICVIVGGIVYFALTLVYILAIEKETKEMLLAKIKRKRG